MDVSTEDLLSWYEQVAVIRRTEKAAHDLFLAGLVKGTTHLAAGQEAALIFVHVASATDVLPMTGYGMAGAIAPRPAG